MTTDVDDKFHQGVWQVLQKLREERRFTPIREQIEFSIKIAPDLPDPKRQGQILTQLHDWQVIKIANAKNEYSNYGGGDTTVTLEILQPKFGGVYGLYENGFIGMKMDAKEFSRKLNKFIHSAVSPTAAGYKQLDELWELSKGKKDKPDTVPEPSSADKKKLCILEKLKEEKDLAGLETRVPDSRYEKWVDECGLEDEQRLNDILIAFQNEGVITSFRKFANFV